VLGALADTPVAQRRVKMHIAAILEWEHRTVDNYSNPARRKLLPRNSHRVEHFAALDYRELPKFMTELRRVDEIPARALEMMFLCGTRPSEVIGARWSEIDLKKREWLIPPERMRKTGMAHRIPLSDPAVALLRGLYREARSDVVFLGQRSGAFMYANALQRLIERMGRKGLSAHGCARAGLKTWAGEETAHPHHVIEQALGHKIPSAVERAYARGELFAKRRVLMADWAKFLVG
jgi:integrase